MSKGDLKTFTIYGPNQIEHTGKYVVRRFTIVNGAAIPDREPLQLANNLKEARHSLPSGLIRFGRNDGDDPSIIETWI